MLQKFTSAENHAISSFNRFPYFDTTFDYDNYNFKKCNYDLNSLHVHFLLFHCKKDQAAKVTNTNFARPNNFYGYLIVTEV